MNILLACKAEPDLSMLAETDWQDAAKGTAGPDPRLMRTLMGVDEQGAAELMLRAQARDPSLTLAAISVGDERALPLLRHLAALGFSDLLLADMAGDLRFASRAVATQIALRAQALRAQLVVLGAQSSEGQNGQTGWLVAEMLGWPCLSPVCDIEPVSGGFQLRCDGASARQVWTLDRPAVVRVRNRGELALRVPGMRARLAAASTPVGRQICASPPEASPLESLTRVMARREGRILTGASVEENVRQLLRDYPTLRGKR